ncbi:hypothetical protein B0I00_2589 [Novosphingobium kunmingense]|uniref:Beta-barrel assembly machine subunit BamE n=1 Tax=Novosphingobium kunmingense TaxID=1211806 RepID=A0A2N0H4V0_9SPHN|nr:hypothetical protein [Novosphingobium kunmingense]PKB13961.1 hypothetical protein B0I00_2589 [Novosphingobium kunmingense]
MPPRTFAALALLPLLAACGGSGTAAVKSASAAPPPARTAVRAPVRKPVAAPHVQVVPGLEGVIGATPAELTRQFGAPRLDVWEGDARKLQFSGTACVLDVYLYPPATGSEPTATYVDARRASDGQDVDRVACASALKRLRGAATAKQG